MSFDLRSLEVASPCPAKWEEMAGDARVRFCMACSKNVYDLSTLTGAEIDALISKSEGRICGRLWKRADGTVITADCPVGLRERARDAARGAWLRIVAFAGAASALLGLAMLQDDEVVRPPRAEAVERLPEPERGPPAPPPRGPWLVPEIPASRYVAVARRPAPSRMPIIGQIIRGPVEPSDR